MNFKKRISSHDPSRSTSTFCMQTVYHHYTLIQQIKFPNISNFEVKFRVESVILF